MADPYGFPGFRPAPNWMNGSTMTPPMQLPSIFGIGGGGGGLVEGVAQSVIPMIAEMMRKEFGGHSFVFGSDMNVASAESARRFMNQMMEAKRFGANRDEFQINRMLSGMARMMGHDMENDTDAIRAVGRLSGDVAGMLPILANTFPDYVDKMLPRGSMTVAAASFVNAGRFVRSLETGKTLAEDPEYGSRVMERLLMAGPKATAGLGAGRLGQTFEELVSRGLISGTVDEKQVEGKLKEYSGAIAAINDIFAENGRSNAPMKELIAGLQTLTQGGMTLLDPAALATTVRMMQATSHVTGMNLDRLGQFAGHFGGVLEAGGVRGTAGAYVAQRAAAFGRVLADRGMISGGPDNLSLEEAELAYGTQTAASMTSDYGKLVGAVLGMGEFVDETTPLGQLVAAMKKGGTSGGGLDILTATVADIDTLAKKSGLSAGALQRQILASRLNKAAIERNQGAFDSIVSQRREMDARRVFTMGFNDPGFGGVDGDAVFNAFLAYQADPNAQWDGNVDFVRKALGNAGIGVNAAQLQAITTHFVRPDLIGGFQNLTLVNGELRRATGERMGEIEAMSKKNRAVQHLMRGGWLRNISNSIANYSGGSVGLAGLMKLGLGFAGMTTGADVAIALAADDDNGLTDGELNNIFGEAAMASGGSRTAFGFNLDRMQDVREAYNRHMYGDDIFRTKKGSGIGFAADMAMGAMRTGQWALNKKAQAQAVTIAFTGLAEKLLRVLIGGESEGLSGGGVKAGSGWDGVGGGGDF